MNELLLSRETCLPIRECTKAGITFTLLISTHAICTPQAKGPLHRVMQVDRPGSAPLVLEGHTGEVSGVAWCQTDQNEVATCGDDAVVKVWRVNREAPKQQKALVPVSPVSWCPADRSCSYSSKLKAVQLSTIAVHTSMLKVLLAFHLQSISRLHN